MAEQELAENTDEMAASMAAAAVAADIDDISRNREEETLRQSTAEPGQGQAEDAGDDAASAYLTIKELRSISRARSLRLQPDDVIVAIDGVPFDKDIETFLDIMFESDPENGRLLTIWRDGVLFNVMARGPLGCVLEHTKPDIAEKATEDFASFTVEPMLHQPHGRKDHRHLRQP